MPLEYAVPTEVVSKSAKRVRLTQVRLMLRSDDAKRDTARFQFSAYEISMIDDPEYEAPPVPQIDDPDFVQPDPKNPVAVPQIDDPDYVAPKIPQIEKLEVVDNKTVQKTLAEVAAEYPAEFAAVHAGIKKVAYAYAAKLFPAGGKLV